MISAGIFLRTRMSVVFALRFFALIALIPQALISPATAQSTSAEPGKIEDRIHKPSAPKPGKAAPTVPGMPTMDLRPDGIDEQFVLAGVEITGATIYPESSFASMYENLLAQEIKVSHVQRLIKKIVQRYRDDGYFLANAVADPQDLALGVLKIRIVEGTIERVTFSGDVDRHQTGFRAFAAKIKTPGPARLSRLERYMMLIDDLPGVTVDGALNPIDKDNGAFELVLKIIHQIADGYVSLDNRGTRAVGEYQSLLSGNLNTGIAGGGRTGLTLFTIPRSPKELVYGELTHEHHFGTEGVRAWFSASQSVVDAGGASAESDLGSRASRGVFGVSYPVIRSRDHNLSVSGTFDVANQRQDQDDVRDFDDRLRILRIAANYGLNDGFGGQNTVSMQLSQGLDILGASEGEYAGQSRAPSRAEGSAKFTKFTLSASRRQELSKSWAAQLSVSAQKSDSRLLSGEEFYVGGTQFGRAFDSGEISGSDGTAASIELQFGQFLSLPYMDSYQVYGFYDFGAVWETENTDYNGRTSLSSGGGGVRLGFTKSLFGGLEIAKPLNRIVSNEGNKDPRVFFYLLYSK